jgi:hypothetical protein
VAQVWIPFASLVEGKLPMQCLITGALEGVELRDVELSWDSVGARGSHVIGVGPAIAVQTGSSRPGKLNARLPLTQKAYEQLYLSRLIGLASVFGAIVVAGTLGVLLESWLALGAALIVTVGAAAFYVSRQPDFVIRRRLGDAVLFDLPEGPAAASLRGTFAQDVEGAA